MATLTPPSYPDVSPDSIFEFFLPGFGVASRAVSSIFHIDITQYIPYFLYIALAFAAGRYCWGEISHIFWNHCVTTAQVHIEDEAYNYVSHWLAKQTFSSNTLNLLVSSTTDSEYVSHRDPDREDDGSDDDSSVDDDEDFEEYWERTNRWDKIKRLKYTPAVGKHYFWYKGRLLMVERSQQKNMLWTERLYISTIGRNPGFLKSLLAEAQQSYLGLDISKTIIYRWTKGQDGAPPTWVRAMARHPRPLSTVMLDAAQKEKFVNDVKDYLHPYTKRWYSNRGIPYRRGYLFYGPPGSGKSSLCFALAGLLNLKIYVASLNSRQLTEEGLASLFSDLPHRCIILLEDIDTAGITKSRTLDMQANLQVPADASTTSLGSEEDGDSTSSSKKRKDKESTAVAPGLLPGVSLSALLNIIDGVAACEGRILIMTTNHAEDLDSALLRPGRVDMTIQFGYADKAISSSLFRAIYSTIEGDVRGEKNGLPMGEPVSVKDTATKPIGTHLAEPGSPNRATGDRALHSEYVPPSRRRGHGLPENEIAGLAQKFAKQIPANKFTPAQIQGYLLEHKDSPQLAVDGAGKWAASQTV